MPRKRLFGALRADLTREAAPVFDAFPGICTAPRREEGHWREGFIVLPVLPSLKIIDLRRLN